MESPLPSFIPICEAESYGSLKCPAYQFTINGHTYVLTKNFFKGNIYDVTEIVYSTDCD